METRRIIKEWGIIAIVLAILAALLRLIRPEMGRIYDIAVIIRSVYIIPVLLGLLFPFFRLGFMVIKRGIRNINHCGVAEFENQIDYYEQHYEYSNEHCLMLIQAINSFYRDDGPIDEMVKERRYTDLRLRRDYLRTQQLFLDNSYVIILSLAISLIASYIYDNQNEQDPLSSLVAITLGVIAILFFLFFRYVDRNIQPFSQIYAYEEMLLDEKMLKLEKAMQIAPGQEQFLRSKQTAIKELIKKTKHTTPAMRKERIKAITDLEKKNLIPSDGEQSYIIKQCSAEDIILLYDRKKVKEAGVLSKAYLINDDYRFLYSTLVKNGIIHEIAEVHCGEE